MERTKLAIAVALLAIACGKDVEERLKTADPVPQAGAPPEAGPPEGAAATLSWTGCDVSKKAYMIDAATAYERRTGVRIVVSLEDALRSSVAASQDKSVAVIPEGPYVIPFYRP